MSPTVKLTEGPDFAFGARWALVQYYPWSHRSDIIDKTDDEVKDFFRDWRTRPECPWYVKEQYLKENNRRVRAGAGPTGKRSAATSHSVALAEADYDARIADLLKHKDYTGAAAVHSNSF